MAKCLIVEDDFLWATIIQDTILTAIKERNIKIDLSFDLVDASGKALLLVDSNHYDLIITDLYLAKMDGFEMIRKIRDKKTISDLPIIVITAVTDIDIKYEAVRKGATDGFAKPLRGEELQRFLNVVFNLLAGR